MIVSGLVYTFIALLAVLGAVGAVGYGVYLCSNTVTLVIVGRLEPASLSFLQAQLAGLAAYMLTSTANKAARHSLILLNAISDDEEDEEYYDDEDDDGEEE